MGGNERVLINGLFYFDNSKSKSDFSSLRGWVFSDILKCVYRTMDSHTVEMFPSCNSYSRSKLIELMDDVALVDVDHCYLQVANKLGYVGDKDYKRLLSRYQQLKIDICAAFTSMFRETKCTYINKKGRVEKVIECNNYELEIIRNNIINYSCSIMANWKGDYYSRNVDGIWIPIAELESLESYLMDKGLKYKVIKGKFLEDNMLFDSELNKIIHL